MASYNDYVNAFQAYAQASQAKDPAWQAWERDAARYTPDMGVAPAWTGTDWFGEWFNSMSPAQQQEYLQRLNESRAADAKSITGRLGQVAKLIPAAVGGIGAAGAAGLLNGTAFGSAAGFGGAAPAAAAPGAAAIEAAVGIPELGLASQTGLGAAGAAAPAGAAAGGLGGLGAAGAAGGSMGFFDLIGPAASIGGALIGSNAAGNAADSQAAATNAAIAEQRRQFDLTRADYAPYRETGVNALQQLAGDINRMPTPEEVMSDPGYQFGMQQGQRGLDNKISAMGGRVSGQAIKAASRFNTDYASGMYGQAYQRRQDRLNRLAALAGIGQTSTNAMTAANQNGANNISQLTSSMGDAMGASQMARGSVWGNALNSAGAQLSDYYRNKRTTPTSSTKSDPWAYWE